MLQKNKLLAQEEVQKNVSDKMEKAMQDLAIKGEMQRQIKAAKKAEDERKQLEQDEIDEEERIMQARLKKMMDQKAEVEKNRSRGYGELTRIREDEFFPLVTSCYRSVVHFYNRDFHTCQVVDERLKILSERHLETRFATIDAEKAPFLIQKLRIIALPVLVCFESGVVIGRVTGLKGHSEAEQVLLLERELIRVGIVLDPKIGDYNKALKETSDDEDDDDRQGTKDLQRRGLSKGAVSRAIDDDW